MDARPKIPSTALGRQSITMAFRVWEHPLKNTNTKVRGSKSKFFSQCTRSFLTAAHHHGRGVRLVAAVAVGRTGGRMRDGGRSGMWRAR